VIRLALLFAAFLGSLSLVVWRQSQALELLRSIDSLRRERAVEEARRTELVRQVDALESRSRIVGLAADRFGMRVPTGDEIVLLPLTTRPAAPLTRRLAASAGGRAAVSGPPDGVRGRARRGGQ
jgi:cell division protein FtsL